MPRRHNPIQYTAPMPYHHTVGSRGFAFADLRTLMARTSPLRSGDQLAGIAAADARERVAAQMALADVPLADFLNEAVVPYEDDALTRLILDAHDMSAKSSAWRLPAPCSKTRPS